MTMIAPPYGFEPFSLSWKNIQTHIGAKAISTVRIRECYVIDLDIAGHRHGVVEWNDGLLGKPAVDELARLRANHF